MSKLTNDPFESRQAINMPSAVWLLRKPIISHDMASHRTRTLQTQRWAIAKTTGQALQLGIRSRHLVLWDNVGWIGHQSGTVPGMMIRPLWHHQVTPLSCSTASPLLLCNTPYPPCRITQKQQVFAAAALPPVTSSAQHSIQQTHHCGLPHAFTGWLLSVEAKLQ